MIIPWGFIYKKAGLDAGKHSFRIYVDSQINNRENVLKSIRSNSSLSADKNIVVEDALSHLKRARKNLREGELTVAMHQALRADRRIFRLFLSDSRKYKNNLDIWKSEYVNLALTYRNEVSKEKRNKIDELINQVKNTNSEESGEQNTISNQLWLDVVTISSIQHLNSFYDDYENWLRIDMTIRSLALFSLISFILVVILLILSLTGVNLFDVTVSWTPNFYVSIPIPIPLQIDVTQFITLLSFMVFGMVGATLFGILSHKNILVGGDPSSNEQVLPESLNSWIHISRIFVGALAAPIVVILLQSGIINLGQLNSLGYSIMAFSAGYSETFLSQALEPVISDNTPESGPAKTNQTNNGKLEPETSEETNQTNNGELEPETSEESS